MFSTRKEAREAGWHSRRNQTRNAQDEAKVRYHQVSGKKARQAKAFLRNLVKAFHS